MPRNKQGVLLSTLVIDKHSRVPYYRQLEESIRRLILNGDLSAGSRLPATRQLSLDLDVSRITVKNVYEQLSAEEFLESRPGAGTFVASISASELPPALPQRHLAVQSWQRLSLRAEKIGQSKSVTHLGGSIAFRPGVPALDQFPRRAWASAYSRVVRQSHLSTLGYGKPGGEKALKRAIADHIRDHRGVNIDPEQVIITAGAQQAFSLIAFTLLNPGDVVWSEDPGHIAGRDAMRLFGAEVKSVPIDSDGFDLNFAKNRYADARLIFATPSHQHPLGVTMSLNRRLEILEYAQQQGSWIVEDDYDSEFRYHGRSLSAMHSLDSGGHVLYVGSFSKSMFPALRLGYLISPPGMVDSFSAGQTLLSQTVSPVLQLTLAHFLEDGSYNAHIRKMRALYKVRHDTLVHHLKTSVSGLLEVQPGDAGLHLIAWLVDIHKSDLAAAELIWDSGVDCLPVSIYTDQVKINPGIMLGFACADENEISSNVNRLGIALQRL